MVKKHRILFVGPLPPPIDGQSKATAQALLALESDGNEVVTVNLNRGGLDRSFFSQVRRLFQLIPIYSKVLIGRFKAEIVYISLSESILGNIKDILIYMLLIGKLDNVTIHMLGGSGMDRILNSQSLLSKVNGYFMRRMRGVIVEGSYGYKVFDKYFTKNRIHVVPNFVDDYLVVDETSIRKKFDDCRQIQVLFLSNMLVEKGYLDLLNAFICLPLEVKSTIKLKFVGDFPKSTERESFLRCIRDEPNIEYLGKFIDGDAKRMLYSRSHVFCLPTYYPYEGQPISILEAYAMGCAVLTTHHGGIPDIFIDSHNGYLVFPQDTKSIVSALTRALNDTDALTEIAVRNAKEASDRYRSHLFRERVVRVIHAKGSR